VTVAFCFPGQGSLDIGMGRDFAEAFPECGAVFAEGAEASGLDLARLCFEGPLEQLTETAVQQPALVTASLACLRAVERLGVEPAAVVGHSVGEYSAIAAAGALSARDAIGLVSERARATAAAAEETPGAMAAILGLPDEVVEKLCSGIEGVWPANYNCPGQIVVSGREDAVEALVAAATERGARRAVRLRVTGAFHSPLVGAAARRLQPAVDAARWAPLRVPFVSTVTGDFAAEGDLPRLLVKQLTAPVRFTQAIARLVDAGIRVFVEIGPGQVLAGLVKRCDRSVTAVSVGDRASLEKLREVLPS
jgi:[acyl-carrier-protein] S-malonyltransferase